MKNLILIAAVMLIGTVGFAQLKVVGPTGDIKIGDTASMPFAKLDIAGEGNLLYLRTKKPKVGSGAADQLLKFTDNGGGNFGSFMFIQGFDTSKSKGIAFRQGGSSSNGAQFTLGNTFNQDLNLYFIIRKSNVNYDAFKLNRNTRDGHFNSGLTIGASYFSSLAPSNGAVIQGSVGIGTNSPDPSSMLHVNGKAVKTGTLAWEVVSDKRLKKDIKKYKRGLDEILDLNPVSYKYNGKGGISDTKTEFVGLIAQEYQEIAPEAVSDFKYNIIEATGDKENYTYAEKFVGTENYLSINSGDIVFMLVNAVKEQQAILNEKDSQIEDLENRLSEIESLIRSMTNVSNENPNTITEINFESSAELGQNAPNPFNEQTFISYIVPNNALNAQIHIFDISGKLIKNVTLENGKGKVSINAGELVASTYSYSLIVDGKLIDSKKMIITK